MCSLKKDCSTFSLCAMQRAQAKCVSVCVCVWMLHWHARFATSCQDKWTWQFRAVNLDSKLVSRSWSLGTSVEHRDLLRLAPSQCEGALVATWLDPFDHYGKYPLVSPSVTPNTAALLSLRATGQKYPEIFRNIQKCQTWDAMRNCKEWCNIVPQLWSKSTSWSLSQNSCMETSHQFFLAQRSLV